MAQRRFRPINYPQPESGGGGGIEAEVNDLTDAVTWANVPNANITESSVTQHQAALILTESQITDLGTYVTAADLSGYTQASANETITGAWDFSGKLDLASGTTTLGQRLNLNANYVYTPAVSDIQNFANDVIGHIKLFCSGFQPTGWSSLGSGNYVSGIEFRHALSSDYRSQLSTYSSAAKPSLVMRHRIAGTWGDHYTAAFSNYDENITGEWTFSTANVTELLSTARGVTGKYEDAPSSAWGGTIYGMGSSFDGAVSGTDSISTSVYGLRWLRGAHAEADTRIGEGMYVFQNGSLEGGIGAGGIYSAGPMEALANLRTRADLIVGDSTARRLTQPTLRGTINAGGGSDSSGVGSYNGYSINNDIMFMHNGSIGGIYDEVNNQWRIRFDTDLSNVVLYNSGAQVVRTHATGLDVGGANSFIGFYTGAFGTRNAYIQALSGSNLVIQNEVLGGHTILRARTTGGVDRALVDCDADVGFVLNDPIANTSAIIGQTLSADSTTSAQIRHRDSSTYDIGLNVTPEVVTNASFTFGPEHVGGFAYYNTTTARTITLDASDTDVPVGAQIEVFNSGFVSTAASITITDATADLIYMNGIDKGDLSGSVTLLPGGIVTVRKLSTAIWLVIGSLG